MSLWLTEQGIEHRRVFADTGWEHPDTYAFLRDVLPKHIGPIEWVRSPRQMAETIRHKGMFPSRLRRYCTEELKVFPIRDYIAALDAEVVNAVGIRRGESVARARLDEWEWANHFDCWTWRPLLRWSIEDVITIHRRHGIAPNPLYLKGAARVGCWPCIFARKAEIRMVAELTPARIDEIRALEVEVEVEVEQRLRDAANGTTPELRGHSAPAFFAGRSSRAGVEPIDSVVAWALRGGEQEELFPHMNDGCMRWGLCDTGGDDPDPEGNP